ncbi:MAG: c-type cytochrome biogenesis protein CcmI, partial [Betaproteobacteria bacterium]
TSLTFWALALALVAATLAVLVVALVRARARARPAEDDASAAIYRDQARQLDADLAAGVIDAGERAAAHDEIVARLSVELSTASEPKAASTQRSAWIAAIVLVAIVPSTVLVAYLALGNPQALDAGVARKRLSEPEIVAMVERLAARMKAEPADPNGWLLLGRSWSALQRYEESANAYAQAVERLPGNADALADWADALAMAQGRTLAGKPTEIVERALAIEPAHPKALALAASAAMERRDDASAIRAWNALLAVVPPDSEDARGIRATIAQLGGAASAPAASAPVATAGRIAGRVVLAPALAARVAPQDTVFVYARAVQGPRVPLAVLRASARDLPLDFALDDSMAMAPGATLSSAREVVIEARISKSGQAMPSSGDLTGQSRVVAPGASGLAITIDRVVP